jgi:hypothetical protein
MHVFNICIFNISNIYIIHVLHLLHIYYVRVCYTLNGLISLTFTQLLVNSRVNITHYKAGVDSHAYLVLYNSLPVSGSSSSSVTVVVTPPVATITLPDRSVVTPIGSTRWLQVQSLLPVSWCIQVTSDGLYCDMIICPRCETHMAVLVSLISSIRIWL